MEAKVTISKKRRNAMFYHLGLPIPYNLGKKCMEFTITLGKATGERSYTAGVTLGSSISQIKVKVLDQSDDQLPKNNGKKQTDSGKPERQGKI